MVTRAVTHTITMNHLQTHDPLPILRIIIPDIAIIFPTFSRTFRQITTMIETSMRADVNIAFGWNKIFCIRTSPHKFPL